MTIDTDLLIVWARVAVRGDVTDGDRKILIGALAQNKRGRQLTPVQVQQLTRIVQPFRDAARETVGGTCAT
jgi:hypothetical protein